ncbi:DUF2145 domain-containing protein [Mitsuaria sp. GD03876]|uniref:DUF2145 domain-containing protein n=1 Tax=Mitsuaria sp. GD03876 TaxID=2975399 RepID=UPI00244AB883|nr:DUF2145 domain-containing protein [Mitsuaria sp. GD03876]MDH0863458.1 DUF2145 domain-containing protein [Mitsuaria sp. GD03876]
MDRRAASRRCLPVAALLATLAAVPAAHAGNFCDRPADISATEQDRQLQVVALARRVLEASGVSAALVSRSGTDLSRFRLQYSHSGLALKDSRNGPWSVRQLYYACDESRAKLYDQGLAGFLLSAGNTDPVRLSIVTLPDGDGERLAARALDNRLALALLSSRYSANAYAFGTRYQNCNQWVAELMGFAWAPRDEAPVPEAPTRAQAQRWLGALGYDPAPVVVPSHAVMFAAQFVPLIHTDDHPVDDLYAMRLRVSTPDALEAFAHRLVPRAQRIEFCASAREVVIRRGWTPLPADCRPGDGDEVRALAS